MTILSNRMTVRYEDQFEFITHFTKLYGVGWRIEKVEAVPDVDAIKVIYVMYEQLINDGQIIIGR